MQQPGWQPEGSMGKRPKLKDGSPCMSGLALQFWPQARKHRGLIAFSLMALIAEVALRLREPWPLKFVFDYARFRSP
jgi:ATP-binding cassette, subfamily B, bacterial